MAHRHTTNNIKISLLTALATELRANGYDVYWRATGETEAQTKGLETPVATVTLTPDFPDNPSVLRRLKTENAGEEEIVVPAFAAYVPDAPRRQYILGLGHRDYEWARQVIVDGFAADAFQQADLLNVLSDWLQSEEDKEFAVGDYDLDPQAPPSLSVVRVTFAHIEQMELVNENPAVKFYLKATIVLGYEE